MQRNNNKSDVKTRVKERERSGGCGYDLLNRL